MSESQYPEQGGNVPPAAPTPAPGPPSQWFPYFEKASDLLQAAIDRFSWPGLVTIAVGFFVVFYATDDQKHEIVDLYILGKGVDHLWGWLILQVVWLLVGLTGYRIMKARIETLEAELKRVSREKSELQRRQLGSANLSTSETPPPGDHQ